jgi:hypothetical protein
MRFYFHYLAKIASILILKAVAVSVKLLANAFGKGILFAGYYYFSI